MNRRTFLSATAIAAAAATMPALRAADAKRRIRKGIMWGTVGVKGSVLEKAQAI